MTEKDLLDSLRFVDDDLIEEAGLEQLKEEKQKKTNGKVIFLGRHLQQPQVFAFSLQEQLWEERSRQKKIKQMAC